VNVGADVVATAADIRTTLGYEVHGDTARKAKPKDWETTLATLVGLAEEAGILVMRNSMVGHNTRRPLRVDEFRGFALADGYAPLVFINANDAKAAQMFTLVHEIAHIWTGESALSDPDPSHERKRKAETWCDAVAAETLVPMAALDAAMVGRAEVVAHVSALASAFSVSELVILRRLRDAGRIDQRAFVAAYRARLQGFLRADETKKAESSAKPGGPSFYAVAPLRVSKRFARALVESTLDGHTLYRDAFHLLGVSSTKALEGIGKAVGAL
jgi:Zn-dependent peptidase ImmA (M78 family)